MIASFTDTFATANETAAISTTPYGWAAGAGGEYALMNGWSIKAEYLYADLGSAATTSRNLTAGAAPVTFPTNVFTHTVNLRSNIARGRHQLQVRRPGRRPLPISF